MQLRIPGPTPCPDKVLQATSRQMINHRGKEFGELINQATERLKQVFQTRGDVFILTGSGTGGMEAAIVNTLSPGDKVLALSIGVFGDRFADIAEQFGTTVRRLNFEWGYPVDIKAVRQALEDDTEIRAVLMTHNDTSTGVTNDLGAIGTLVREFDKLLIVDAVSSMGSLRLPVDDWGCDVVVTGSQKGWMAPPGLAMVSMSPKAWQFHAQAKLPRYYWDFSKAKKFLEKGQTPWTPAVSVCYALAASLDLMLEEGLGNVVSRHDRVGSAARKGVKSLGLSLFPDESCSSNTVTAVRCPEGFDAKKLLQVLREEHGVVLSGGQQRLEGKIFRIGHLGWVQEKDIEEVMAALHSALPKAGFGVK